MPANIELITTEDLKQFKEEMVGLLQDLRPALANAMDRYMTIEEVVEFTQSSDSTVRNWIKLGKKDRFDNLYKLEAEEFAPGQYRILRSKLIEYGKIKGCVAVSRSSRKNKAA